MIAIIATAIACFIVGGILSYILFRYVLKSKYDNVLKEAETEAEVIHQPICCFSASIIHSSPPHIPPWRDGLMMIYCGRMVASSFFFSFRNYLKLSLFKKQLFPTAQLI